MAAPGASYPAHLQTTRRTEAHQQRLLEVQAELLAAKHPILSNGPGAKPAGLYNEGNTCFFNSTFQALAATTSLIDLIGPVIFPAPAASESATAPAPTATAASSSASSNEQPHLFDASLDHPAKSYTAIATGSDGYELYPHSIPSLLDAALEPENARLLPVTLAFEKCLGKAWKAKDEGLRDAERLALEQNGEKESKKGSAGDSAEKEKSVSLKALLRELGRKYDQYEDVSQAGLAKLSLETIGSMPSFLLCALLSSISTANKTPMSSFVTSSTRCQWRKKTSSRFCSLPPRRARVTRKPAGQNAPDNAVPAPGVT